MWMARKTPRAPARRGSRTRRCGGEPCGPSRARLWIATRAPAVHRRRGGNPQGPVDGSLERFHETGDEPGELLVPLAHRFDLPDGVQDGRVVFAAERRPDGGERLVDQVPAQVHGDLAREGDVLRVVARLELDRPDLEVGGHELLDGL